MRKFYLLAAGAMLLASNAFAEVEKFPTAKQIFNLHSTEVGISAYDSANLPSLAVLGGNLIVCEGDATNTLTALNGLTGEVIGSTALEGISVGSITNDAAGNMLIVNVAAAGTEVNIYRTNAIDQVPTLFHSFTNDTDLPCGIKMTVNGDIDGKAVIVLPLEGVAGVTTSTRVYLITVNEGVATAEVKDLNGVVDGWEAGTGAAALVTRSNDIADGFFTSKYGADFRYVDATGAVSGQFGNDTSGWGLNPNFADSKIFNGKNYLALFVESHFPSWGMGPEFYLYDVTDMANFTGTAVNDLACLVYADDLDEWYQAGANGAPWGNVILSPDEENEMLYAYALAHSSESLLGYKFSLKADEEGGNEGEEGDESGVADVVVDENAPVEYFNLQGVRVANPENGIFVRRQGNQVSKVVVK